MRVTGVMRFEGADPGELAAGSDGREVGGVGGGEGKRRRVGKSGGSLRSWAWAGFAARRRGSLWDGLG